MLAFDKNKIEAQHNVIHYSDRVKYNGKLLGFVKNKIEAELKDLMKLKEKNSLVFSKIKIEAELKNVLKQDLGTDSRGVKKTFSLLYLCYCGNIRLKK